MEALISKSKINALAIPAVIAGIAEPVLSITDTAIVGNIPDNGLESLAAAGIVGTFLSMLVWILGQTRSAVSSLVSQYLGREKLEEILALPAQAIFLNLMLSLVIVCSTFFVADSIFAFLNAKDLILEFSISYFEIRIWGFPFTMIAFSIIGTFQGLQNTVWPMLIAITGAGLNILLDIILVYGIEGIVPAMALEGAAWASLIAQITMAVMALIVLAVKTPVPIIPKFPIHKEMKTLVGMTLNLFVRTVSLNVALILAVREATAMGDAQIGAHTIAINLWLFSAFFVDGYSQAGKILGGRIYGAGNFEVLRKLAKRLIWYGVILSIILALFAAVFYYPLGRVFSGDKAVLGYFYSIFFIVLIGLPFNAVAFIFDGLYKGMGKMRFLRNVLLIATFLGFVPLLYLGKFMGWGLYGIWAAFSLWLLLRGGLLLWDFSRKFRPKPQMT